MKPEQMNKEIAEMTLRDYFAAHVVVELDDAIATLKMRGIKNMQAEYTSRWTAEYKYMVADEILKARTISPPTTTNV